MAVRKDTVNVDVVINGRQAGKTLGDIQSQTRQLEREIKKLTPGSEEFNAKLKQIGNNKAILKGIQDQMKGVGKAISDADKTGAGGGGSGGGGFLSFLKGGGVVAAGTIIAQYAMKVVSGLKNIGKQVLDTVLQMEAYNIKTRQVFGEALPMVNKAARENADALGLTAMEYKAQAANMADLLVPMGLTREESAKMSIEMVNLSAALSQWSGGTKSAAQVNEVLTKAMLGERDGLKQLGISINDTDVKTRLAAKGQENLTGAMLKQAQAMATQELILEKSTDAQDAFANNTQTAGRAVQSIKSDIKNLIDDAMVKLAPYISGIANLFGSWTDKLRDYLAVKPSEEFAKEQISVNGLAQAIMQAGEGTELRKKLITQMQAQYPGFLAGMKDEEITNGAIRDRLKEVNEEYQRKIILATQQELIEEATKKQANALKQMAQIQSSANTQAEAFAQKYGVTLDRTKSVEEQIRSFIPALAAAEKAQDGFGDKMIKSAGAFVNLAGGSLIAGRNISLSESQKLRNALEDYKLQSETYKEGVADMGKEMENYRQLLVNMGMTEEEATKLLGMNSLAVKENAGATAEAAEAQAAAKAAAEKYAEAQKKAAASIEDLKIALIDDEFDQKIAKAQLDADRRVASLVGTPEQIEEQAALIRTVLQREIDSINEARAASEQKAIDERRKQAEEEYQAERDMRIQRTQEQADFVAQEVADMEAAEAEKKLLLDLKFSDMLDAEAEHQEALRELHIASLDERLAFMRDQGQQETALYKQVLAERLQADIDANKARVDNAQRTANMKAKVEQESYGVTKDILQLGIDLMSVDEAARKKNAAAIKAFSIGQIAVDLAREIAAYMAHPASTATMGVVGALQMGVAIARAALSTRNVLAQKFEHGGMIGGVPDGPRHSEGGISLINSVTGHKVGEMEGGEPYMILSRETYRNNRNIVDRLLESSMYRGGKPIFATGGVFGPIPSGAGQSSSGAMQTNQDMIAELRQMRSDLNSFNGRLSATISYDRLIESTGDVDGVKSAATL